MPKKKPPKYEISAEREDKLGGGGMPVARLHRCEIPDEVAVYAMKIIERFALISGTPDGVDDAGRAKLNLMSPEDIVDRAFEVATRTYAKMESDGHMIQLGTLADLEKQVQEKEDKRDNGGPKKKPPTRPMQRRRP